MRPDPWSVLTVLGLLITLVGATLASGCAAPPSAQRPAATTATPANPATSAATPATGGPTAAVPAEKAVAPEQSPPGDIPDNQAFVSFAPTPFVSLKYPEGWSRQQGASSVSFTDKLNTIDLAWSSAASAPTVASIRSADVAKLAAANPAFELRGVKAVSLPSGPAILTRYRANSASNPVTGKKYRLDIERYTMFHDGHRVDLTLLSPAGADNVNPWRIVSRSVAWKP